MTETAAGHDNIAEQQLHFEELQKLGLIGAAPTPLSLHPIRSAWQSHVDLSLSVGGGIAEVSEWRQMDGNVRLLNVLLHLGEVAPHEPSGTKDEFAGGASIRVAIICSRISQPHCSTIECKAIPLDLT